MSSAILSIIFGLASAVCWGTGDFTGGYTSKRTPVYTVTLGSLLVGGTLLLLPALLLAEPIPSINSLIIGGFAGIFGTLGLVALYLGLSSGQMGVVSPVAALVSATLPVVFGIIGEGIPPFQQLVGFIFAFIAVWFLSRGNNTISPVRLHDLKLPVLAGIGFGSFFILIDHASNESILWPLISAT
ncbi:MAG: EamA family transporter, partial [Anaerolineales bacterium]